MHQNRKEHMYQKHKAHMHQKGDIREMASCRKLSEYTPRPSKNQQPSNPTKPPKGKLLDALRHNSREQISGKSLINHEKSCLNYCLNNLQTAESQYAAYKQIKSEAHCMNRRDVAVAFEWCVPLPKELLYRDESEQRRFFEVIHNHMQERYRQSALSAWVHNDESTPHYHGIFLSLVDDKKRGGKKFCCKEIINLKEYITIYDGMQAALDAAGIHCRVKTGVTKAQGGNRNFYQERQQEREREQTQQPIKWKFNIRQPEKERSIEHDR